MMRLWKELRKKQMKPKKTKNKEYAIYMCEEPGCTALCAFSEEDSFKLCTVHYPIKKEILLLKPSLGITT